MRPAKNTITNINFALLNTFLAVATRVSARSASEDIGKSQPAITKSINNLEKIFGTELFERTSKGMNVNQFGAALLIRAERALNLIKKAEIYISQKKEKNNRHSVNLINRVTATHSNALQAFCETNSFTHAGKLLSKSEPTIHRAMRELEVICGIELWRREGMRTTPTFDAIELSRFFALAKTELRFCQEDIKNMMGMNDGKVIIGTLPLSRSKWLPQAIINIRKQNPNITINIIDGPYESMLQSLKMGKIDFILGALRGNAGANIEEEYIFDDPLAIVVRNDHPFAKNFDSEKDKLSNEQLTQLEWILPRENTPARDNFNGFMQNKNIPLPVNFIECSSLVATRSLLLNSDMAALLSARQIKLETEQGLLKIMGPPLSNTMRKIGITYRKDFSPTKLQKAFLNELRQ
jgi:DNA-binding transcriptional LysR family regulator